jgi:hypothetical protein
MTTSQVRSPRSLRSLLAGLVLVVALLSLAEVATPTAHADAIDNMFLGAIKANGIDFASPQPRSLPPTRSAMNLISVGRSPTSRPR